MDMTFMILTSAPVPCEPRARVAVRATRAEGGDHGWRYDKMVMVIMIAIATAMVTVTATVTSKAMVTVIW